MTTMLATAATFDALAHPLRRTVIEELSRGERPAMALAGGFEVTPGALSQHLRVLRDAGLVTRRREGRLQVYALEPAPLREVAAWAARMTAFWDTKLDALGAYLEKQDEQGH